MWHVSPERTSGSYVAVCQSLLWNMPSFACWAHGESPICISLVFTALVPKVAMVLHCYISSCKTPSWCEITHPVWRQIRMLLLFLLLPCLWNPGWHQCAASHKWHTLWWRAKTADESRQAGGVGKSAMDSEAEGQECSISSEQKLGGGRLFVFLLAGDRCKLLDR